MNKSIKSETLTVKVTPEIKAEVKRLAAEKDWTVSKWLYNTLIKSLEDK